MIDFVNCYTIRRVFNTKRTIIQTILTDEHAYSMIFIFILTAFLNNYTTRRFSIPFAGFSIQSALVKWKVMGKIFFCFDMGRYHSASNPPPVDPNLPLLLLLTRPKEPKVRFKANRAMDGPAWKRIGHGQSFQAQVSPMRGRSQHRIRSGWNVIIHGSTRDSEPYGDGSPRSPKWDKPCMVTWL